MVARVAITIASKTLPEFAHKFSPKKFTQAQLFACLVLKTMWKCDFRTTVIRLSESDKLLSILGLKAIPHFTTLHKASMRLLTDVRISNMLNQTVQIIAGKSIGLAAVDSTGFESGHISPYFLRIRQKALKNQKTHFTRWPKFAAVIDTKTHLILTVLTTTGPGHDSTHFKAILDSLPDQISVDHILADAGYDSEANHAFAREVCNIITTIPPRTGRPGTSKPRTTYRKLMDSQFDVKAYRQRWQVETVFSMIKRNLAYAVLGVTESARNAQMLLLAITHNLMILLLA